MRNRPFLQFPLLPILTIPLLFILASLACTADASVIKLATSPGKANRLLNTVDELKAISSRLADIDQRQYTLKLTPNLPPGSETTLKIEALTKEKATTTSQLTKKCSSYLPDAKQQLEDWKWEYNDLHYVGFIGTASGELLPSETNKINKQLRELNAKGVKLNSGLDLCGQPPLPTDHATKWLYK